MASGLIWSALGEGIGDFGKSAAAYLARNIDREDRQEERRRELQERREYEERRDALYRRTAEQQAAGRSGGGDGGLSAQDVAQGGSMEGTIAGLTEGSVPALRRLRAARDSGDFSGYQVDVTKEVDVPNPDNPDYDSKRETRVVKDYPPGFEREISAKLKRLSQIEESYRLGKNYDEVAKGRMGEFELEQKQGIVAGTVKPETFAAAQAAGKGELNKNLGEAGTYNVASGASTLNPLGTAKQSQANASAAESSADADKARAEIKKIEEEVKNGTAGKQSSERLTTMINSANATIKNLMEGSRGKTDDEKKEWQRQYDAAVQMRDRATKLLNELLEGRSAPAPSPAPAASASGESPASRPAASGSRKVGDTQVIQSGPNKGKTARWDGKGWVLVNR